ncbi:AAA family ATPase [Treponema primitia]|uniref:AAA family ATPase n=1 Tax=Treponema primitia TaxID=88058 RepID=UPI00397FB508
MKKIGLTLGKYAPFHKGHALVVDTMLKEMDAGILVIYHTGVTPIPLCVRSAWIRKLYPKLTVIEAWDGPEGYSNERSHEIKEEEYIKKLLGKTRISAFYSGEFYGEHMSRALHCEDRRIDEARKIVPVSGTVIREDPFKYREFIDGIVYRDLIIKVVFVGAMSTGKSTLTEALAKRYHTVFASEYGRDYWTDHQVNRRIGFKDFDIIATRHIEQEEKAVQKANRYLFVDTNAITTYMYALDYHGRAPKLLTRLALENASRYDLFFLCEDDIPYDDTWDRSGSGKREVFHRQTVADLLARKIPYIPLRGSLEERMEQVDRALKNFVPYSNYFGNR